MKHQFTKKQIQAAIDAVEYLMQTQILTALQVITPQDGWNAGASAEAALALMTLDYDKCRKERGEFSNQLDQLLTW